MSATLIMNRPTQRQSVDSPILQWSDGTTVVLRPLRPEDVHLVMEMYDRCSSDSLYFRYLHPYRPTLPELESLVRMKPEEGATFVAAIQQPHETIVALAQYRIDPQDRTVAQPAILVQDQFQGLGLGRWLARCVADDALVHGVRILDAVVHPENQKAIHLIDTTGYPHDAHLAYGALEMHIRLESHS